MARASVKLAGVAMSGSNASWFITAGAASPSQSFAVHPDLDAVLRGISGKQPIDLVMEGNIILGGQAVPTRASVGGLYLRRREGIVAGRKPVWSIADVRSWWENLWVSCLFSGRRQLNEFRSYGVGPQRNFNRTAVLSYMPLTMIAPGSPDSDPDFATGADYPQACKRWTAKAALLWLLKGFFRTDPTAIACPVKPRVFDLSGPDSGRPLSDWRAHGRWSDVANTLARLAHVGITPDRNGNIILYSLAPTDFAGLGGTVAAGTPTKYDLSRSRAERLRVMTRVEREMRLNFLEMGDATTQPTTTTVERFAKRDISLNLDNVLILPNDVTDTATGERVLRGTIVSLPEACRLWNQDPDNPPPFELDRDGKQTNARIQFSLAYLRRWIHTSSMATQMTNTGRLTATPDPIYAARASVLYSSYRRVFRFPPAWLDMIEGARLERVAIQDAVFGKRNPSQVYMDHFIELTMRGMISRAQGGRIASAITNLAGQSPDAAWNAGENYYAWGGALRQATNFEQLPLRDALIAPCYLSWVNQRQLVFKIDDFPDLAATNLRVLPGTFTKIPISKNGGFSSTWEVTDTELETPWRMSTIVSVTLRTPNNTRRFFSRTYTKSTTPALPADATGPALEIFSGAAVAGIEWVDPGDPGGKASRVEERRDGVRITGGRLCNPETMRDVCDAVAADVVFRQQDRTLGAFDRLKANDAQDLPRGEITTVEINYADGRIVSRHYADAPPIPPAIFDRLSPAVRDVLYRLEQVPPP